MVRLKDKIMNAGIENVYFLCKVRPMRKVMFVSYTSSNDPQIEMLCKIDESQYKVEDNYKITLKPMYEGFAYEHYYFEDLESIIKDGHIKMLIGQTA